MIMKQLKSQFAPQILEYGEYRRALKYSQTHIHYLQFFDDFCYTHFSNSSSITPKMIKAWFDYERDKRPGVLRDEYFSINGFLRYHHKEECILSPAYLQRKRHPQIPYIMTNDEIFRFFDTLNNLKWNDPLSGFCVGTILRLLYSSGLRPTEARMLKCVNVDLQSGEIFIEHTKRHTERIIILSNEMLNLMIEYDVKRRIMCPASEYFFVHSDGRMITQHFLWVAVDRCWKTVMFPETDIPLVNPYSFRHLFASTVLMKWLDEGKDIFSMIPYLKAHMGHSHYSSTVYYIHMLPQRLLDSTGVDWESIEKIGRRADIWAK